MRVERNENLEKELFDWFKRMHLNNWPISGTILKQKAISCELQAEEHALNGWFEGQKTVNFV